MANILNPNQSLYVNQFLISPNGKYKLIMQTDGNLVLYRVYDNYALWSSGTAGQAVSRVIMQGDGNLVIYLTNGRPIWASRTQGNPGSHLRLQDDGNLVIYKPLPIWYTGTVQGLQADEAAEMADDAEAEVVEEVAAV
jgi:hypothetical protein